MIKAGVRTAMITTRVVPAPLPRPRVAAAQCSLTATLPTPWRHGRSKELPMPPGYDGERQLAELHALIAARSPLRLPW